MKTFRSSHPFHLLNDSPSIELAKQFKIDLPILYKNIEVILDKYGVIISSDDDGLDMEIISKRYLSYYEFFDSLRFGFTFLEHTMEACFYGFLENELYKWDLFKVQYIFDFYTKIALWARPNVMLKNYKKLFKIAVHYADRDCKSVRSIKEYFKSYNGIISDDAIQNLPFNIFYIYDLPAIWKVNYYNLSNKELKILDKVGNGENLRWSSEIICPISKKESSLLYDLPGIAIDEDIIDTTIIIAKLWKDCDDHNVVLSVYHLCQEHFKINELYNNLEFWKAVCNKIAELLNYLKNKEEQFSIEQLASLIAECEEGESRANDEEERWSFINKKHNYIIKIRQIETDFFDIIHEYFDFLYRDIFPSQLPMRFVQWSYKTFDEKLWEFHQNLNLRHIDFEGASWKSQDIHDFEIESNNEKYYFTEIIKGVDLLAEGTFMQHCVAYMIDDFTSGRYHLWSIKKKENDKCVSFITAMFKQDVLIEARLRYNQTVRDEHDFLIDIIIEKYKLLQEVKQSNSQSDDFNKLSS